MLPSKISPTISPFALIDRRSAVAADDVVGRDEVERRRQIELPRAFTQLSGHLVRRLLPVLVAAHVQARELRERLDAPAVLHVTLDLPVRQAQRERAVRIRGRRRAWRTRPARSCRRRRARRARTSLSYLSAQSRARGSMSRASSMNGSVDAAMAAWPPASSACARPRHPAWCRRRAPRRAPSASSASSSLTTADGRRRACRA